MRRRRSSSREDGCERRVAHVRAADVREQHEAVDVEVVAAVARSRRWPRRRRAAGATPSSPNRPGWSTTARRPASFTARARSTPSPKCTPGDEIDSSDVAMPSRSIERDVLRRPTTPGCTGSRRAGRGRARAARPGRSPGGSGRGRRSSRVERRDPVEERVDVEVGFGAVHRVPDGRERAVRRPTRRPRAGAPAPARPARRRAHP